MDGLFAEIHKTVAAIPAGKVATYGQIAVMVGRPRAARTVVWALHNSPAGLPCHRVVAKTGKLAPDHVFGSQDWQRGLLQGEGVSFRHDGSIDMELHQWQPADEDGESEFPLRIRP